jgi:hypothetical protein
MTTRYRGEFAHSRSAFLYLAAEFRFVRAIVWSIMAQGSTRSGETEESRACSRDPRLLCNDLTVVIGLGFSIPVATVMAAVSVDARPFRRRWKIIYVRPLSASDGNRVRHTDPMNTKPAKEKQP